jgi:predicted glycosyltransferase
MRILIEAHHPGDIHFWKYPVQLLLERGHKVLMVARDRDVMRRLVEAYSWIPYYIPKRGSQKNKFPLLELFRRQWTVGKAIHQFQPDVVASLFGSYCQSAWLLKRPNIIFTDSEFQHFNHRIAHPFASEIHTPYCFYKPLGAKQQHYNGIHELSFLDGRRFQPDVTVVQKIPGFTPRQYVVIRLSAWNTFHDINQEGIGAQVSTFINTFKSRYRIVISAEENQLPDELRQYAMQFPPEDFHHVLAFARFVLTEGASTASEAACLGVPTVYINSTEPRGYLCMLEKEYGLVKNFQRAEEGVPAAVDWLSGLDDTVLHKLQEQRSRMVNDHCDVCEHVVKVLEKTEAH